MKRVAAIILSLTMVWLQVLAAAPMRSVSAAAAAPECGCCAAQKVCRCCCVAPAPPAGKPLPAAPVAASSPLDFAAVIPKRVAWLLPASAPVIVPPTDNSSLSLAVPLFTQHCARLI